MPARGETRYLFYVDGAEYFAPQPAVPTGRPNGYYLPRIKRHATLGKDLFASQSEARRVALANAQSQAPA